MADGYEIFDTGHGSMKCTHYRLNAKEIDPGNARSAGATPKKRRRGAPDASEGVGA